MTEGFRWPPSSNVVFASNSFTCIWTHCSIAAFLLKAWHYEHATPAHHELHNGAWSFHVLEHSQKQCTMFISPPLRYCNPVRYLDTLTIWRTKLLWCPRCYALAYANFGLLLGRLWMRTIRMPEMGEGRSEKKGGRW